jgi:MFS transporter, putative metabolite:H+ symporter
MFAVVVAALAATVIVLAPIGPRTTGKSLDEVNPI